MGRIWIAALALALLTACGPKIDGLEKGETGKAAEVRDGDTFVMEDGLAVHLAGVEAPRGDQPHAAEARAALEKLVAHRTVQLAYGGQKRVREAAVAHVFAKTEGGRWVWVQQALLLSGDARVHTRREQVARLDEMRAAEAAARAGKRGLWAQAAFAVKPAAALARSEEETAADPVCAAEREAAEAARVARAAEKDEKQVAKADDNADGDRPRRPRRQREFEVVEGRVSGVVERERAVFVNFGDDITRDFGVMIATDALQTWPGGLDAVKALAGKQVRVRGDVGRCGKPLMRVDHAAQVEVIGG
jgi:endonuclease YncB( thermonuclease family)